MAEAIVISPLRYGVYRLSTSHEGMTLTAQDLRDLFDWCLRNMTQLEQEARQLEADRRIAEDR